MPNPPARIEDYVQVKLGVWWLWIHKDIRSLGDILPADGKPRDGVRGPFQRIPSSRYARVFNGSVSLLGRTYDYFLKEYLHRSPGDFLKHFFRPTRACGPSKRACCWPETALTPRRYSQSANTAPALLCQMLRHHLQNQECPTRLHVVGRSVPTGDAASRAPPRVHPPPWRVVGASMPAVFVTATFARATSLWQRPRTTGGSSSGQRTHPRYRRLRWRCASEPCADRMLFEDCLGAPTGCDSSKPTSEKPCPGRPSKPLAAEVYARTRTPRRQRARPPPDFMSREHHLNA